MDSPSPIDPPPLTSRLSFWLGALLWAAVFVPIGLVMAVMWQRIGYPYDLEWMEGGMLCHALRLMEHKPLYGPPSVDFIPYLYTPFYPALLAWLSSKFTFGYLLARKVSVLGFNFALFGGYLFATARGVRYAGFWFIAFVLATFVPTGAWFDLARPDSLYLGLVTWGLLLGWWGRTSRFAVSCAAVLLVAAFFTKQTATPFMIGLALALLVANWRVGLWFIFALALFGLPLLAWFHWSTQGWFWTYVFHLHQQHEFYRLRAFIGTPVRLAALFGPSLLLLPLCLFRIWSADLRFALWIAALGVGAACLGFGTQWAFYNAFIPGVFFLALAIAKIAGEILAHARGQLSRGAVYLALLGALACAPGGLLPWIAHKSPVSWGFEPTPITGYDLRPYVPRNEDRLLGDALLANLRLTQGEVLIPFHPFYGYLAGKKTYLHRMGVMDIARSGMPRPEGLELSFAEKKFALVVMDDKIDGTWQQWPGLRENYGFIEMIAGPRTFSGAATVPKYLMRVQAIQEP